MLFASAASPSDHSARQVLLTLSEITLIEGPHADRADWKDLPHRVAALEHNCAYLTTYNVDDYEPGHPEVEILRPGALVRQVREQLSSLWLQRPVVLSLSPVRR